MKMMVPGADMWGQCLEINIWTSAATGSVSSANSHNKFVKNKRYRCTQIQQWVVKIFRMRYSNNWAIFATSSNDPFLVTFFV